MKPDIQCLRCIMSTRLREIEQLSLGRNEKLTLSKEIAAKIIEQFNWDIELTDFASEVLNTLYHVHQKSRSTIETLSEP
jgi:hypothetical protein